MLLEKNARLVFAGDSVTDVGRNQPVAEGTLFDMLGKGYPQLISGWLNAFYPELNLYICNAGTSGNTSRDLLRRWDSEILDKAPTWVSIMIGINDIWRQIDSPAQPSGHVLPDEFRDNVAKMIEKTLAAGARIILWTPSFIESNMNDAMAAMAKQYGDICAELAQAHSLLFIDMNKKWERILASGHHPEWVSWDRVHPNNIGHTVMAKAFLDTIGFDYTRM